METKTTNDSTVEGIALEKNINAKKRKPPYILLTILSGLFFMCWILALLDLLGFNNPKEEIGTWRGNIFSGDNCSYTLLKHIQNETFELRENSTGAIFECTEHTIKNATEYYFVDPDKADINDNLACFNFKKGTTIYIIHYFGHDSVNKESIDGILVPFSDNDVRIYLDMQINGTAYYCNNGNPPISRINENGTLEYCNIDGSNEPAYECYAKLH